jgi:hypothetical protein
MSVLFELPIEKTLPACIDGDENPIPTLTFHRIFGPSFGHGTNQLVSEDIPFQFGPRQLGQSFASGVNPSPNSKKPMTTKIK